MTYKWTHTFSNIMSASFFYICYPITDSQLHIVIEILSFSKRYPVWGWTTLPTSTEYKTQKSSLIDTTFHDITARTY